MDNRHTLPPKRPAPVDVSAEIVLQGKTLCEIFMEDRGHLLHPEARHSLKHPVRRVRFDTDSESPNDVCEGCMDTGWGGDRGPGWRGNDEVGPCACDPQKRARRNIARRNAKPPNA
jgi:hypothetical protein